MNVYYSNLVTDLETQDAHGYQNFLRITMGRLSPEERNLVTSGIPLNVGLKLVVMFGHLAI